MLKNSFYDVKIGHRLFPESLRRKTKKDAETGLRLQQFEQPIRLLFKARIA